MRQDDTPRLANAIAILQYETAELPAAALLLKTTTTTMMMMKLLPSHALARSRGVLHECVRSSTCASDTYVQVLAYMLECHERVAVKRKQAPPSRVAGADAAEPKK